MLGMLQQRLDYDENIFNFQKSQHQCYQLETLINPSNKQYYDI